MSKLNVDEIINNVIDVVKNEIHEKEQLLIRNFIKEEFKSESFLSTLENSKEALVVSEVYNRDILIVTYMLLGMGRNRTVKLMESQGVNRKVYEKVRDLVNLKNNDIRVENEKKITNFKIESTKRTRRLNEIVDKVDWENFKERYSNGESVESLSIEHKISSHLVKEQLKDEGLYDETRSTLIKKAIADKNKESIDDNFIKNIVEDNPLESKDVWWEKSKEKYPWILRRQFYDKLDELGLTRTNDEVNAIRSLKSKTMTNTDYAIKVNSYKAIREVFGNVSVLVDRYMDGSLGSYRKIADKINREIDEKFEISTRQVERIITGHPNYKPKKSAGQHQLFEFINSTFKDLEIIEEFSFTDTNKRIDVYIPELKIGFEFNGDYWHSNTVIQYNYNKSAYDFHKERVEEAAKLNVKLLYVWENDWNENYNEVEKAIIQMNWNSEILNKYESDIDSQKSPPSARPGKLRFQIMEFLRENDVEFIRDNNSSIIEIVDYDIVINTPNYNSLSIKKNSLLLQKYYEEKNVELLTFLPWRNISKIKEFLSYRLNLKSVRRISARKCQFEINNGITDEQRVFFNKNHLLGYGNFRNIEKTATLTYEGKVVIAAVFKRNKNSNIVELKRLVSEYGISVQGGASRLLKSYIKQSDNVKEIYTYSDCDLGFGNVYNTLGFDLIERSVEQLTWYNEDHDKIIKNLSLIQVGADRLLKNFPGYEPVGIGDNLPTNQEIVQAYGFIPIYDSGYKKWSMKLTNN